MQGVSSMFSGMQGGASAGGASAAPTDGSGSANLLSDARAGTSAVSALSSYAMSQDKVQQLKDEAFGENLQAADTLTQAQQKSNDILRTFHSTVQTQQANAAANGVDIGSGSVVAAGKQAEQDADRQINITQNTANMNAALRRGRAAALAASAKTQAATGTLDTIMQLGQTAAQFAMLA